MMHIVFFGSSKYSTIDAKALFDAFGLSLIVTTSGTPNPVKEFALAHTIPLITTDKLTPEVCSEIARYKPDFLVTADIRLILPNKLLDIPTIAPLNVHHSLLPKFRGPAPVPFSILSGDTTTGVSIIMITENVDAGDIFAQEIYDMTPHDTTDSVLTQLNELGGKLVVKVIKNFGEYNKNRKPQDEKEATYSHYMTREDGFIDINDQSSMINNQQLDRMIRAYFPWPGVWTKWGANGKEKIVKLLPEKQIQVEGRNPMSYKDFMNGYPEGKEMLKKLGLYST